MNASPVRCSIAELEAHLTREETRPSAWRLVDVRSPAAFARGHVRGAANLSARGLLRSVHLLPPRGRPLLLMGARGEIAAGFAAALVERGWREVRWLDGSPRDVDTTRLETGPRPNRLWEPSPLLAAFESELPRNGPACDLACGSGRNAVFLALGGRRVIGVDLLPDALRQARMLARAARIPPPGTASFRLADLSDVPRTDALLARSPAFTLVTCFRFLQRDLLPRIGRALAPGGVVVYETFLEEQARVKGKPRRPEWLLRPGELLEAFSGFEIVHYAEDADSEGNYLASLVARRSRAS